MFGSTGCPHGTIGWCVTCASQQGVQAIDNSQRTVICIIAALLYPHVGQSVQEAVERARLLWLAYDQS